MALEMFLVVGSFLDVYAIVFSYNQITGSKNEKKNVLNHWRPSSNWQETLHATCSEGKLCSSEMQMADNIVSY